MPIYEYYCKSCDCEFETLVFRSSDPVVCPDCDTEKVTMIVSYEAEAEDKTSEDIIKTIFDNIEVPQLVVSVEF